MLVRREAMERVGLLDPGFFMYGEDLDWCTRFRRAGWDVLYNGTVTMLHVKGATAGTHRRLRQNAAFHQSMGRFYRRHLGGEHLLLDGAVYAGIGAKLDAVGLPQRTRPRARAAAHMTVSYHDYLQFPGWEMAPAFLSELIASTRSRARCWRSDRARTRR